MSRLDAQSKMMNVIAVRYGFPNAGSTPVGYMGKAGLDPLLCPSF